MASVIVVGKQRTRELELADAVTVVGRDGGATLELGDLQLSRRHALLVRAAEGFFVKDLGSKNGVLLNRQRVPSRQQARLKNGDVLAMGRTTLIFKDLTPAARPAAEPTAPTPPPTALSVPVAPAKAAPAKVAPAKAAPAKAAPAKAEAPAAPKAAAPKAPAAAPAPKAPAPRAPAPKDTPPAPKDRGPDASIPRALPPPSGAGAADLLVLRALERAERERVFYRNLVLVLTGVVVLVLVALLAWALLHARGPAAPAPPVAGGGPGGAPEVAARPPLPPADLAALDAGAFAREVQPVLAARCASCHGQVGRGGGLVLAASDDPATVAANLSAVRRFVVPGRPQESPLALAPLPAADGGTGHGGGDVLRADSPEWRALAGWIARAGAPGAGAPGAGAPAAGAPAAGANRPPTATIAAPAPGPVGQPVALDASGSADPDGDPLTHRWTLKARPAGSKAAIDRPGEARAQLTPDVPGAYAVALVVHDGRASAAAEVELAAVARPEDERGPAAARAFEALCGRPPTEAERAALAPLAPLAREALAAALLERPEPYACWWDAELAHLGLEGEHRPRGEPWASIPTRLAAGRVSAPDVLQAVALGQAWAARHAGRDAAVDAVLERFLALDPAAATAEREAARRMFDGFEAELLGVRGSSQADLARIVVGDERTRRALLARAHRRVVGHEAPAAVLDPAVAALGARPKDFFLIIAGWATQRVP